VLVKEGVNTLVLEINYRYQFQRHPEVADADALSLADARAIAAAARESGIELIPLVDLLGHQSWAGKTFGLLKAHPEFDETPGLYKDNAGIYCRSYCPLHPQVHAVLFDVIDEILDAFEAKALHGGMDEVFLIGEDTCVRCKGKDKAQLFAGEVRAIHDHLAEKGRRLWIWSDRLIDGKTTGIGEWEASQNGTAAALREIPRDVVLCDWHYESAHPTALAFALDGFDGAVVAVAPDRRGPAPVGSDPAGPRGGQPGGGGAAARRVAYDLEPVRSILGGVLEGRADEYRGAGRGAVLPRSDAARADGVNAAAGSGAARGRAQLAFGLLLTVAAGGAGGGGVAPGSGAGAGCGPAGGFDPRPNCRPLPTP
jgi:hypothetical protein